MNTSNQTGISPALTAKLDAMAKTNPADVCPTLAAKLTWLTKAFQKKPGYRARILTKDEAAVARSLISGVPGWVDHNGLQIVFNVRQDADSTVVAFVL